jgi:hypothetical protein
MIVLGDIGFVEGEFCMLGQALSRFFQIEACPISANLWDY